MKDRKNDNPVLVIADDFTGANDAGVTFARRGSRVDVVLDADYQSDGQAAVCILNSDSRALAAAEAYARVFSLLNSALAQRPAGWLVKKMDSTLRGNPGAEAEAMMKAANRQIAFIAPAFPSAGRTLRAGLCRVNQALLTETEFASDPKTPVPSADIREIFGATSNTPCISIDLETLRAGKLSERVAHLSGPVMVMIDGEHDGDLDRVVEAASCMPSPPLLIGSAGLCDSLARRFMPHPWARLLAVVGSMSEMTQRQIACLRQRDDIRHVFITIDDALNDRPERYQTQIVDALRQGEHCIVHTSASRDDRHQVDALCGQWQLSRGELGERICAFLGALTRRVVSEEAPGALYLSGGDVALAASRALGASGFRITGSVAQCVPWGHFLGSAWQMPVMTKAGGFGDETTLLKVLHFIEENVSV